MKQRQFIFAVILLFLNTIFPLHAQELVRNSSVTGTCYAGKKITRVYVPPPKVFFQKAGSKSGGNITVNYSGFSSQAKAAIQYAVSILQTMLPADTRFTINTTWEKISTTGVLAQSTIPGYAGGAGIDALNPRAFYPLALAEKIAGRNLSDALDGDIKLSVNSSISWYLGTDGNTPKTNYDLVTVVLHEICHGLGFFDSFSSDGTLGSYGLGDFPMIYDTFVENVDGSRLTDTTKIQNNSSALQGYLTHNNLYFNGPLLKNYSSTRAKLYAPVTWDAGSSVSHLDESAYSVASNTEVNALMTPFIDLGEAIHDPGKFTFSILGDLGWINTRILHTPGGDTESHLSQITLSAEIKSDTTYNHNKVVVVYSFNNFLTRDSLFLNSPNSNNVYNTTITIPSYNSQLQYYFEVEDHFHRLYRSPSAYKDTPHLNNNRYRIFIGTDTIKPVISHTPPEYYLQVVDTIKFNAKVTDNLGLDSVYVEYRINNGSSKFIRLKNTTGDIYNMALNAKTLSLKGHDSIQYKIFAVDTAKIPNLSVLPKSGYFVVPVEEISSTVSKYSTDFSTTAADFFNVGFTVSKPAGFTKFGLNSKHPYESPLDNSKTINSTSILRHPIIFSESGMLVSFNEIVLVEPGETGSIFGSSGFYDYVILEGSRNFGKTWFNLLDGYNCRLFSSWLAAYNSSIVGDNSTYTGKESMLQNHTFLYRPTDNISAGDTLLLRFRLFSDPFANGWGWVIEDLKISPLVDALPEVTNHKVSVYPNPGHGNIRITTDITGQLATRPVRYRIFNASGICLIDAYTTGTPETVVDISRYPAGLYIILLNLDDGIQTIKYSLTK